MVVHAPLPVAIVGGFTTLDETAYVILHAPALGDAYSTLGYPSPPLYAEVDSLYTTVSLY